MRRHLLRPSYGLARADFYKAIETIPASTRALTTTQAALAEDNDDPPQSNRANARSEVRNLVAEASARKRAAPAVAGNGGPSFTGAGASPAVGRGAPKVINIRSLPKGLVGRLRALNEMGAPASAGSGGGGGGGSGGGGLATTPDGIQWKSEMQPGSEPAPWTPYGDGGGDGGGRGMRGRGGRGGRAGRGGLVRRRKAGDEGGEDEEYAAKKETTDDKEIRESPEERAERHRLEVGATTQYNPTTSLETLIPFLPEVATDSNPLGRVATVITNLKALADGIVDTNPLINSDEMYRQYKKSGMIFYAEPKTKGRIEWGLPPGKEIYPIGEEVKDVVMRKAVKGEYDEVKAVDYRDVVALARRYHLQEGSYLRKDIEGFEKKLAELVAKANKGPNRKAKTA